MFGQSARTGIWERRCLFGWILFILALGILPLSNFVGHSHWEYIKWIPTVDDLRSPKYLVDIFTDIVGNTALFFPLGYLLSRAFAHSSPARQLIVAASIGGILSLAIEFYQVYCHSRFPSIFDVFTNVAGAVIGVRFSLSRSSPLLDTENPALTPIPPDRSPVP